MGRAFEYRKARKEKRWASMAKAFTRAGREIGIAVKEGGGDPAYNPRLRLAIQNAKTANVPKANIENAIKKALAKDAANYDEVVYEGYAPHGIAMVIECASDNTVRTVANVRSYFNKTGGSLGKTGSLDFLFDRKGIFTIEAGEHDLEELELELIDFGADELEADEESDEIIIYTQFGDFGNMQQGLEELKIEVKSAKLERIPHQLKELTEEQKKDVNKMLDKLDGDDDVQHVFHTMA